MNDIKNNLVKSSRPTFSLPRLDGKKLGFDPRLAFSEYKDVPQKRGLQWTTFINGSLTLKISVHS